MQTPKEVEGIASFGDSMEFCLYLLFFDLDSLVNVIKRGD